MVELFGKNLDNGKLDDKVLEIINKQYNQLLKDRKRVKYSVFVMKSYLGF